MSKSYEDSRFGVEKVLTFPSVTLSSAPYTLAQFYATEDMYITEIGVMVTTKVSGSTAPTLLLAEGATTLATLSVPTDSAIGALVRSTSVTNSNISNTDTLVLRTAVTATTGGVATPYIKYRERFV